MVMGACKAIIGTLHESRLAEFVVMVETREGRTPPQTRDGAYGGVNRAVLLQPTVHLATVANAIHHNYFVAFVNRIHDPVVTNSDPVLIAGRQLRRLPGERVHREIPEQCNDPLDDGIAESGQVLASSRGEPDVKGAHRA